LIERTWRKTFTDYFESQRKIQRSMGTLNTTMDAASVVTADTKEQEDRQKALKSALAQVLVGARALQSALIPLFLVQFYQVIAFDWVIADPRYRVASWVYEIIMKPTIDWVLHVGLAILYFHEPARNYVLEVANFQGGRLIKATAEEDTAI
jgi:hypothetical protein